MGAGTPGTTRRKRTEGVKRAVGRREREDAAGRLSEVRPGLRELSIAIEERHAGDSANDVSHIRRVVVQSAPALFEFGCCDRTCDGGHDLTKVFLRALGEQQTEFEGDDACGGQAKEGFCRYTLHYQPMASYGSAE